MLVQLYGQVSGKIMAAREVTSTTVGKTETSMNSPPEQIVAAKRLESHQQNTALAGRQAGGIIEPEAGHRIIERIMAEFNP